MSIQTGISQPLCASEHDVWAVNITSSKVLLSDRCNGMGLPPAASMPTTLIPEELIEWTHTVDEMCEHIRFNHLPECMYSSSPQELNFAIHVRLGDRTKDLNEFEADYVDYIQSFMDTVTNAVTRRGLDSPRFHIFSETFSPCPDEESRTFREFPAWPVEEYQIQPCLNPLTPEDCPEKRAGALSCNPTRSGIFRVSNKPLYLHVGLNVQNEITCMTKADGVLMGCSTFGQISGVLNKGLKFFSFECAGARTPNHYKMMPPLAVAEQGNLWVPIAGSWHNPSILSETIFEAALDQHLEKKGVFGKSAALQGEA